MSASLESLGANSKVAHNLLAAAAKTLSVRALEEAVIRPPGAFAQFHLGELWRYRGTLLRKTLQRIRIQYDGMLLSFFWAVARPLLMVAIFWTFRGLARAEVQVTIPYPLYVYTGLVFWFYFADATTAVAMSLQRDAGLIKKVYFPRLVSPLSHLLAETYTLTQAALPLAVMMVVTGEFPGWRLLLLPFILLQIMALALGTGMLFSSLVLKSRDWERAIKLLFYVGLWISPVVYAVSMIPDKYVSLYLANPVSGSLLAVRAALFEAFEMPWESWGYTCAASFVVLLIGLLAFQRAERTLADRL